MFERQELIAIRERAKKEAKIEGLNQGWARAYLKLADAADHLDAMNARCEERADPAYEEAKSAAESKEQES